MTDVKTLIIPKIDGTQEENAQVWPMIANHLYTQSEDIKGSELGRRIWNATEPQEFTAEERKMITAAARELWRGYVINKAVEEAVNR